MDSKEFYMEAGKIVVYPGSVDELNRTEELAGSGKYYEPMQMKGGRKYLTGIIIPSISESKELLSSLQAGAGMLQGMGDMFGLKAGEEDSEGLGIVTGMLEGIIEGMAGNPTMMKMDIRMKAKEIGADGLVHFQMYNKNDTYIGVPVILDK